MGRVPVHPDAMIPLVTDLNRCATMSHDLRSDTTPDFEVGDTVEIVGYKYPKWRGRVGRVLSIGQLTAKIEFEDPPTRVIELDQLQPHQ